VLSGVGGWIYFASMATSDPIEVLLAHDRWATRLIVEACAKLTPEQFHQRFEMGPGSLHDTATHIIGAMRVWADTLAVREQRARPEGQRWTTDQLLKMLDEAAVDLAGLAKKHPLDGMVSRVREGKTYQFTRGAVLTHVTTHGMHHRAQCLNMLRQVGVKPLPPSSVTEWTWMTDKG
jgi:uncharacterized damage-inducible protein DinB